MADSKITALTATTTPADTDIIPIVVDPAGTPITKKITWTTIKAFLKTYFDTLYPSSTVNYKAKAHGSSDVNIANGTWDVVSLQTEDYDPNNNFTGNTYTAPVSGYYQVNATLTWNANGTGTRGIGIRVNSGDVLKTSYGNQGGSNYSSNSISTVMYLTSGNTVNLIGFQSSGGDLAPVGNVAWTIMDIHFLSKA